VEREAIQLTGNVLAAEVRVAVVGPFGGCRGGESRGRRGVRCRLTFRNRTDDSHPLHLHRHQFEIAEIYGKATAGIIKDTVVPPSYGRVIVDFTADQPGPARCFIVISSTMWITGSRPG